MDHLERKKIHTRKYYLQSLCIQKEFFSRMLGAFYEPRQSLILYLVAFKTSSLSRCKARIIPGAQLPEHTCANLIVLLPGVPTQAPKNLPEYEDNG